MIRVLYVCSILQEKPVLLPVPPIAGGAPPWNIYRLAEALAQIKNSSIDLTVVSACEISQQKDLATYPQKANYLWYVISEKDRQISQTIFRNGYISAILRRLTGVPSWLAYKYMKYIKKLWRRGQYNLIILDDAPQNLGYLRKIVPRHKLGFTFRGPIGRSREYLTDCGFIVSTNKTLIKYIHQQMMANDTNRPKIFVVPNSLSKNFSKRNFVSGNNERFKIVFTGRIVPEKGVLELLKAFSIVLETYPNVSLSIIGASRYNATGITTQYEREVQQLATSLPQGSVHLPGFLPYSRIADEYSKAQLAVFPSIGVEGFGMVALEAMRCGLPVIVSDRPGFRSFITDNHNGIIVKDPSNISELAAAMTDLIGNPSKRRRLAENGYKTSLDYTPEASARAFVDEIQTYTKQLGL